MSYKREIIEIEHSVRGLGSLSRYHHYSHSLGFRFLSFLCLSTFLLYVFFAFALFINRENITRDKVKVKVESDDFIAAKVRNRSREMIKSDDVY